MALEPHQCSEIFVGSRSAIPFPLDAMCYIEFNQLEHQG